MKILTEQQLAEVDRIITETTVQTNWQNYDGEDSVEVDDAEGTLRAAADAVRKYLSNLEAKETVDA